MKCVCVKHLETKSDGDITVKSLIFVGTTFPGVVRYRTFTATVQTMIILGTVKSELSYLSPC